MKKQAVALTDRDARRLAKTNRKVEREPKATVRRPQSPTSSTYAWVIKTTEIISKMSGTTPGQGHGILQGFDGTNFFDLDADPVIMLNMTDVRIKSGAYVPVSPGYGYWIFMATSCSNEAS